MKPSLWASSWSYQTGSVCSSTPAICWQTGDLNSRCLLSLKPSSTLSRSIAVAFEYIWTYIVKASERSLQESFASSILARPMGEAAEVLHGGPCRVLRSQNGGGSHVLSADSACPPQPCCWAVLSLLSRSTGNKFICMDKKNLSASISNRLPQS